MDEQQELAAWRQVGAQLWPFVRPWGLCGAHPNAIVALENLAQLLGETPTAIVDSNTELLARKKTVAEIAELYREKYFRKMLKAHSEAWLQELESL